jgi:DNA replication protein DnaC
MNEGSDNEMSITLYAPHSKEYKKLVHEQTDKRLASMQKSKKIQISAADLEKSSIDILAKATKEWDITYDGESPKLTVPKAREIYTEYFWIKDQLEEAINDTLDFTQA